jgi:large subunit ribosomal protein L28
MPRSCDLTGTAVRFGRNVSHSNRKTSRTFAPNLQKTTLTSDALKRRVSLRVTTRALRTVQRKGGLDGYLLGTADADLGGEALRLKRQVKRALAGAAKPASD